ncbi:zinc dependent phospholipase C family protein [Sporomusa termitida]|uniref:Phospholipase C n=1 Tax=Sporomusa termitida TaxID=2377 RepID=A0A517E186_9FIRM|nr:zinc dependent phospholipase C family protein [Sporomusa termitida]QDR83348.1 Zinc dependent phospholipase C [Sporomusa termitida]
MKSVSLPALQADLAGANLLLAAASPLQSLFDRPSITHEFLNKQAIIILNNDGFTHCACFLQRFLTELNAGVQWADKGWKNVSHYYEPLTGKGLWQFATALDSFSVYFKAALHSARQHDFAKTAFLLGAAAHLLQDLCVPHHARARLFSGHKEYESWVRLNHAAFAVENQGLYPANKDPYSLLVSNALAAADYLEWLTEENQPRFHTVTACLLPRAQRTTAGLFERFYTLSGINHDSRGRFVTTEKVNIKTDFLQYIENEIILDNYI